MTQVSEILQQLDQAVEDFGFPDLNHGYSYAIDARLHAYSDGGRWALIVETVGYNPRAGNVVDVLHTFGNCLTSGGAGLDEGDFHDRIDNADDMEPEDEGGVYEGSTQPVVRGQELHVSGEPGALLEEIYRQLVPEHRGLLLGEPAELRRRIPDDLPEILTLDDWHHIDPLHEPPSSSETFRCLAFALATGNAHNYTSGEKPNTHWSNWPESGSL